MVEVRKKRIGELLNEGQIKEIEYLQERGRKGKENYKHK